ncbi:MAG: anthranilate synthase component I family protein [Flavobacteriales bacterium]|nr:anthranilate synthase component I family protein [Flavobacteriales bacterium]
MEIADIHGYSGKNLAFLNSNGKGTDLLAYQDTDTRGSSPWKLQEHLEKENKWLFGYLNYDLKNDIEKLTSSNEESIKFPNRSFFVADHVVEWIDQARVISKGTGNVSSALKDQKFISSKIELVQFTSKEEYFSNFDKLMFHIKRGDIYEVNYCIEWFAENVSIDPYLTYDNLNGLTKAPLSCFIKRKNKYILCGSPERFIKREGNRLFSQPIKGTAKRSKNSKEEQKAIGSLIGSIKEKAENVMTVDVVRNDLARVASKNSVNVEELAALHSFETVHHLISTISADLKTGIKFKDILKATFPMASMTGAPKISAMKIIEEVESFKRGVYSGSIGYIKPNGDFDFNVIIRSILYDDKNKKLSFSVGSAITAKSDPEKEYEECLVKAEAMKEALK